MYLILKQLLNGACQQVLFKLIVDTDSYLYFYHMGGHLGQKYNDETNKQGIKNFEKICKMKQTLCNNYVKNYERLHLQ